MPTHLAQWQQFHGPLIAFAVALGLALAGRFLRVGLLAAAAGGGGVVAGWYAVTGRLWVLSTMVSVDVLTGLAAIVLLIGLLCAWLGPGRLAWIGMLLAALPPAGCSPVRRAIWRRCGRAGRSVSASPSRCCCSRGPLQVRRSIGCASRWRD